MLVLPRNVEGAYAPFTDLVTRYIEGCAKGQGFWAVDDVCKSLAVDVSQGRVEKARPNIPRCFNHGRNPGCIAAWCHVFGLAQVGAKMSDDVP